MPRLAAFDGHFSCSDYTCRLFLRSYLKTLHLTVLLCLFCAAAHKREHTGLLAACLVSEVHSVFQICGRMQVGPAPCFRRHRVLSVGFADPRKTSYDVQQGSGQILRQQDACGADSPRSHSVACNSRDDLHHCALGFGGTLRAVLAAQDLIPLPYTDSLRKRTRRLELAALALCRLLPAAALTVAVALQPAAFATRARWGLCLAGLLHADAINARQAWVSYCGAAAVTGALHGGAKAHRA